MDYFSKTNFRFLTLLWLHVPVALLTAFLCGTSLPFALAASLAILAGPTALYFTNRSSVETSTAMAAGLIGFSALLIHASAGMTELHFHIFSSLGVIIMLAQPVAVAAAVLVVVVHHVGFYFFLPASLINYQAGLGILAVHAIFALAIGIPSFFISRTFKTYIVGVKSIIDEVQVISHEMADSSAKMLTTSQTLSETSTREAAAMQQTAASLEELRAMIARNTENAGQTAQISQASREESQNGQVVVRRVVDSLGEIKANSVGVANAVNRSNERIMAIVDVIQEIGDKTKVINDIVFQTKLLSFNASVEAARAGEHGKGFAVVAEEVGKLAQVSGSSAEEISRLLEDSLKNVRAIVEETKKSVQSLVSSGEVKVEDGVRVASDCQSVLEQIASRVEKMATSAVEISSASREQATGVDEITRAMSEVERATQENSAVAAEALSLASSLESGANRLRDSVERLLSALDAKAA